MHSLTFLRAHKSIKAFPTIQIPDFMVLTGKNGAGKSHLLEAIESSSVVSSHIGEFSAADGSVRRLDWQLMAQQDQLQYTADQVNEDKRLVWHALQVAKANLNLDNNLANLVHQFSLPKGYLDNPFQLYKVDIRDFPDDPLQPAQTKFELFSEILRSYDSEIKNIISRNNGELQAALIRGIGDNSRKPVFFLDENEFFSIDAPNFGRADLFRQSFARLFGAYRDYRFDNQLKRFQRSEGDDVTPLSDSEFQDLYGPPPWDIVNKALSTAGLDFHVNAPVLTRKTSFVLTLMKNNSDTEVPFANLSSGEKILLSIATCLYYATDSRQIATMPKLLLLDEVDAPLHPTMTKTLLQTILDIIVKEFGVKVIMTTHSPSTVALAPDNSIYVMKADEPGITKTTKSAALNILTFGIPTLSILYEDRRQVFTEDPSDAETYNRIYQIVKNRLASERSLEFLSSGLKIRGKGSVNTGCGITRSIVTALHKAGNRSVFGLLDWDKRNKPSNRVYVHAYEERDGLENVVFDPLLIAFAICRDAAHWKQKIGIADSLSFREFVETHSDLQQLVCDEVTKILFDEEPKRRISSRYHCAEFSIDARVAEYDDHEYEQLVYDKFPIFSEASVFKPSLKNYIVNKLFAEYPEYVPSSIVEVFEKILSAEIADS